MFALVFVVGFVKRRGNVLASHNNNFWSIGENRINFQASKQNIQPQNPKFMVFVFFWFLHVQAASYLQQLSANFDLVTNTGVLDPDKSNEHGFRRDGQVFCGQIAVSNF